MTRRPESTSLLPELIYSNQTDGKRVRVVTTMTTPACTMQGYLIEEVREAILGELEDVAKVDVELVWEPAWSPRMISEQGRRQLGWQ